MRKSLLIPAAALLLVACGKGEQAVPAASGPTAAEADAFIAKYNADYRAIFPTLTGPQWLQATYINDDSQAVASRANEQFLEFNFKTAQGAKPFY